MIRSLIFTTMDTWQQSISHKINNSHQFRLYNDPLTSVKGWVNSAVGETVDANKVDIAKQYKPSQIIIRLI